VEHKKHQRSTGGAPEEHQGSIRRAPESKEHEEHQRSTIRTTRSIREAPVEYKKH